MTKGSTVFAVAEDVLHGGAVSVPVLHGDGQGGRANVLVGGDEAVGVDRVSVGEFGDRHGPLVGVQGTAPPGARVG